VKRNGRKEKEVCVHAKEREKKTMLFKAGKILPKRREGLGRGRSTEWELEGLCPGGLSGGACFKQTISQGFSSLYVLKEGLIERLQERR